MNLLLNSVVELFNNHKKSLCLTLYGGIVLAGLRYHPGSFPWKYTLWHCLWLLILPLIMIKFLFRDKFSMWGITMGKVNLGWKWVFIFYLLMLPLLIIASFRKEFRYTYPLYPPATASWKIFIEYQLCYGLYMFCWEFFFRGFLLYGYKSELGKGAAIFLQTFPFIFMHLGKPELEVYSSTVAGILLGLLALETESMFYPFLVHYFISLTMDLLVVIKFFL